MTQDSAPQPAPPGAPEEESDTSIGGWVRAVALGIQDTWHDMVEEGRKGARQAYEEYWRDFEVKTKRKSPLKRQGTKD